MTIDFEAPTVANLLQERLRLWQRSEQLFRDMEPGSALLTILDQSGELGQLATQMDRVTEECRLEIGKHSLREPANPSFNHHFGASMNPPEKMP